MAFQEGMTENNNKDDAATGIIDYSQVTQAAIVDMSDVFAKYGRHPDSTAQNLQTMPMPGFDAIFVDIVDYILRITFWIWHDKQVELCKRYYSENCKMHTMTGDCLVGSQAVIDNTWATLKAFPDRTLDGENVVWSVENDTTYYSSHLIVSRMTNDGDSEWGPATHIRARIRTIADCVCTANKIVEEWLMRDNALLVKTLGYDLVEVAQQQARQDLESGKNVLEALAEERDRVVANSVGNDNVPLYTPTNVSDDKLDPLQFAKSLFSSLWIQQDYNNDNNTIGNFYDYRVSAHLTNGRELYGTVELKDYFVQFLTGLSDMSISVDHVAAIPYMKQGTDIAIRWTLTATHSGDSPVLGAASRCPIYILASSHWRIINGRIQEEWTVFDELALLRQVATQRLSVGE